MRRATNSAWLTKIMVSLGRKWNKVPLRHEPLKMQLGLNRGKALGYPKASPKTRQARKAHDKRVRLIMGKIRLPF